MKLLNLSLILGVLSLGTTTAQGVSITCPTPSKLNPTLNPQGEWVLKYSYTNQFGTFSFEGVYLPRAGEKPRFVFFDTEEPDQEGEDFILPCEYTVQDESKTHQDSHAIVSAIVKGYKECMKGYTINSFFCDPKRGQDRKR